MNKATQRERERMLNIPRHFTNKPHKKKNIPNDNRATCKTHCTPEIQNFTSEEDVADALFTMRQLREITI